MATTFADQLQSELDGIQGEIDRLNQKRDLIQQLLSAETGKAAPSKAKAADKPAARSAPQRRGKRQARRPRGMITGKVREFLASQTAPVHATEILKYLEDNDAAPLSAKPLPTLQSTLQRMKEMGEVENRGRNRWMQAGRASAPAPSPAPAPRPVPPTPSAPPTPPVVTSTTTFGSQRTQ